MCMLRKTCQEDGLLGKGLLITMRIKGNGNRAKALPHATLLFLVCVCVLLFAGSMMTSCGSKESDKPGDETETAAVASTEVQGGDDDQHITVEETAIIPETVMLSDNETEGRETKAGESEKPDAVETESEEETEEDDPVIIVLDPGHDSEFCRRDQPQLGLNEQDLNLKIGLACRDRLKKYKGVKVYMTREDGSCPDAEDKGELCIEKRTGIATELGADLFVSLHNNATTGKLGASSDGTQVYISNYSKYTEESRKLGEIILEKLSELDLRPDGVKIRTKEEKGHYDDGSVQDWYYLISYSVEGGHPGIIIEHAFMDNVHDNEMLKDDENLKKMGIADADAIAEYYGLELRKK